MRISKQSSVMSSSHSHARTVIARALEYTFVSYERYVGSDIFPTPLYDYSLLGPFCIRSPPAPIVVLIQGGHHQDHVMFSGTLGAYGVRQA